VSDVVLPQGRKGEKRSLERIRQIWKTGAVVLPPHGDERYEQSRLSDLDIWNVLKHGRIIKIDKPVDLTRYTLRGRSIDGSSVICALEIDGSELILITVYEEL